MTAKTKNDLPLNCLAGGGTTYNFVFICVDKINPRPTKGFRVTRTTKGGVVATPPSNF